MLFFSPGIPRTAWDEDGAERVSLLHAGLPFGRHAETQNQVFLEEKKQKRRLFNLMKEDWAPRDKSAPKKCCSSPAGAPTHRACLFLDGTDQMHFTDVFLT